MTESTVPPSAMNDKWADEVKARREAEAECESLRREQDELRKAVYGEASAHVLHNGYVLLAVHQREQSDQVESLRQRVRELEKMRMEVSIFTPAYEQEARDKLRLSGEGQEPKP